MSPSGETAAPRAASAWRLAAIYAVGLALARATGLLLLPLVTHALPPEEYGRLELLTSLATAGTLISTVWLIETLFRFGAAADEAARRAAAEITGLAVVVAGAMLVLFLLATPFVAPRLPVQASALDVAMVGTVVAAEAMNSVPLGWLRLQNRARLWGAMMVGRTVLHLALAAALLHAGYGVTGVLAAAAIASLAAGAILIAIQWREGSIRFSPSGWRAPAIYGAPMTLNGLALFALNSADLWFLAGHVSPQALGLYALATRLALIAGIAPQPFDLWWHPRRLAVLRAPEGPARFARIVGFGAALVLLSAAGAAVVGPLLIAALTPASYHAASTLLPWLAAAIALQGLGGLVNAGCYLGNSPKAPAVVNVGAAATAIGLYLVLVPPFGVAGAIAATIVAQAGRMVAFGVLSMRRAPVPYPFGRIALVAAACAATAALPQLLGGAVAGPLAGLAAWGASLLLVRRLGLTPVVR